MNMPKVGTAVGAALSILNQIIQTFWEFISDTSPWPRRYMELREADGTVVRAIIIQQDDDAYTIEIPRSEHHWYTFWRYQAETKVVFASDIGVLRIDPPASDGDRRVNATGL